MTNTKRSIEFHITLCIMIFIVSSFIGWAYETIITSIDWGYFADRGFLHLPLCPIYGFGAIFLLCMFYRLKNSLSIFMASTISTTLIELVASYALEYFLHMKLWTYEYWPLHFQGRISLWSSVLFGLFGVFLMKCVYPVTKKFAIHMPKVLRWLVCVILLGVIFVDTCLCITNKDDIISLNEARTMTIRGMSTIIKVPIMITFYNQTNVVDVNVAVATEEFKNATYESFNKSLCQYLDSLELAMYR